MRKHFNLKNFIVFTLVFVLINLSLIDIKILVFGNTPGTGTNIEQVKSDCPDCSSKISSLEQEVNAIMNKSGITITPSPTPVPSPVVKYNLGNTQTTSLPKEYYVPFGSGSGNYSDWTDVPGLQAYIDSTAYGNIKTVVFEVSLHIPTGNETASVRLVNATDGRVITGSELNFNGNTDSVFLSSSPITLDYGQKLYKVQMKTQLKYNALIDQSRVHITTK